MIARISIQGPRLITATLQGDPAAVEEDDGAEHGRDPIRARKGSCLIAELVPPDHRWYWTPFHAVELTAKKALIPDVLMASDFTG